MAHKILREQRWSSDHTYSRRSMPERAWGSPKGLSWLGRPFLYLIIWINFMENREEKYVYFIVILLAFSALNYLVVQNIKKDIRRLENIVDIMYDKLECIEDGNCPADDAVIDDFLNQLP